MSYLLDYVCFSKIFLLVDYTPKRDLNTCASQYIRMSWKSSFISVIQLKFNSKLVFQLIN